MSDQSRSRVGRPVFGLDPDGLICRTNGCEEGLKLMENVCEECREQASSRVTLEGNR